MSRNTFLTSGLILGLVISPAVAVDDVYTTDIADSCTVDVLGSVEGNAANSFTAQYAPNKYTSAAGTYLLFSNGEISENQTCPTGSFCPGFTDVDFADSTMGLNSCPSAYSLSAAGAKTEAECYRQCTAGDVAHSKATGTFTGMFYSNETNACEPINDASCADGYHYKAGSTGLNVDASINAIDGGYKIDGGEMNSDKYRITTNGTWVAEFSYGLIMGKALCSTTEGEMSTVGTPDESGGGTYCWCKIDEFIPINGSTQNLSGAWFRMTEHQKNYCETECMSTCFSNLMYSYEMRRDIIKTTLRSSPAICEANEITVTWDQANGQGSVTNTCTYDGDITLPTAPTKTGYTFSGWKLVTGSSSNE